MQDPPAQSDPKDHKVNVDPSDKLVFPVSRVSLAWQAVPDPRVHKEREAPWVLSASLETLASVANKVCKTFHYVLQCHFA